MTKKYILSLLLVVCALYITACSEERQGDIYVEAIPDLSETFIKGVDVSSVLALEESGVVYYGFDGKEQDIFKTLEDAGVNSVRIRVWNDPYDSQGNGYGGGNNDIDVAIELGKRATQYNHSVLVDFHYSDFWADPSKQKAPKAWKDMDIEAKGQALYNFTLESISQLLDENVNVSMIQIGNEITTGMAGEENWNNIAYLLNQGVKAIREAEEEYNKEFDIGVHFTNPEKAESYERYAMILDNFDVDYDVFITSYYPYWHGSLDNLEEVLTKVATGFNKKVLVGEVSYAYTFENGDQQANTISEESVFVKTEPITVQGQANVIRDVMATVAKVPNGLGVYYWEPAWLPVPGDTYEDQFESWEENGSGWASSFAGEYDPEDAGVWYGGTSWDNQAMFDFTGHPLASLDVFRLVNDGAKIDLKIDSVESSEVRFRKGQTIVLPEKVEVIYNDRSVEAVDVQWDEVDANWTNEASIYSVEGYVKHGDIQMPTTCKIVILEPNYIENSGFEESDQSMWTVINVNDVTTEVGVLDKVTDARTDTHSFHFYSKDNVEFRLEQKVLGIKDGKYNLSVYIQGGDMVNESLLLFVEIKGQRVEIPMSVNGWANWQHFEIPDIEVTGGEILIGCEIKCDPEGWGSIDDFSLFPVEEE